MKIIAEVRNGQLTNTIPEIGGLTKYSVHRPFEKTLDATTEHPDEVTGIAMIWLHDGASVDLQSWFPDCETHAYRVDESVLVDYSRAWPDGIVSPGVRRISFIKAKPELTRTEMARHWHDEHWPLARVHHPKLWRYVQNVVVEPVTAQTPEVDAIAELHFVTLDDLENHFYDSDAGREIVAADVEKFIDRGAGWRIVAQETWLKS